MSAALDQAHAALRRARGQSEAEREETVSLPVEPTGDDAVDAAAERLGRPLSPNELFNVQQGLAHDFKPEPKPMVEDPEGTRPDELPEDAFLRVAAMRKADA